MLVNYAKERKQILNSANSIAMPKEEVARGQQTIKQEKRKVEPFAQPHESLLKHQQNQFPVKAEKIWTLKEL